MGMADFAVFCVILLVFLVKFPVKFSGVSAVPVLASLGCWI
jgi:hypothetical protein